MPPSGREPSRPHATPPRRGSGPGPNRSILLLLLAVVAGAQAAPAHVFAPALLELRQVDSDAYAVRWKQPSVQPTGARARPRLPETCRAVGETEIRREGTGVAALWTVRCSDGLEGRELAVDGIASTQASVLLRLERTDGSSVRHVLTADAPAYQVPAAESFAGVASAYGLLGVEHIAGGLDHLLFVLGLVLLVRAGRRLLWTVTAFTVGHSITLALAALGLVQVPQAPVEVLIAGSIYLLALDLSRRLRADADSSPPESWMERHPGWMAGGFGLFHGLGFAGALTEAGLPAGDVPTALFAFNVGIELGQLAFVGVVLVAGAVVTAGARRMSTADARPAGRARVLELARAVPVYLIGCLAAYWMIERGVGMIF